eukprot:NODE_2357_length_1200_cov_22.060578_g2243_i0.p1 GENE.NODE_2357_length_1200_cov_22.060578_g2243_i0~~NODE_2357_length_1200_cov_22.060578_g2243_i0.p1  ORF type:complete len:373 (-),score=70.19 NODE_2357_length_1200_cov_22.060578_g2243_i0:80-1159(-)
MSFTRLQTCPRPIQPLLLLLCVTSHVVLIPPRGYGSGILAGSLNLSRYATGALLVGRQDRQSNAFTIGTNWEEPNTLMFKYSRGNLTKARLQRGELYNHTLTLCPYTACWINAMLGTSRRTAMYYPFPLELQPPWKAPALRTLDVIFVGSHHNALPFKWALDVMADFKYLFLTWKASAVFQQLQVKPGMYAANLKRKLRLISHSRVALIHNTLFIPAHTPVPLCLHGNDAFLAYRANHTPSSCLPWRGRHSLLTSPAPTTHSKSLHYNHVPQLKARTFEAAFSGALMLVFDDGFRLLDRYFTPGVDFLYFTTANQLKRLLTNITANFTRHVPMAMRARRKAMRRYTVSNWVRDFITPFL